MLQSPVYMRRPNYHDFHKNATIEAITWMNTSQHQKEPVVIMPAAKGYNDRSLWKGERDKKSSAPPSPGRRSRNHHL